MTGGSIHNAIDSSAASLGLQYYLARNKDIDIGFIVLVICHVDNPCMQVVKIMWVLVSAYYLYNVCIIYKTCSLI